MTQPRDPASERVYFITRAGATPPPPVAATAKVGGRKRAAGVELQSKPTAHAVVERTLLQVREDWRTVVVQVNQLIVDTKADPASGFHLDEVSIGLAFDAKGKIGFIAEAGVEASIHVVFKRG